MHIYNKSNKIKKYKIFLNFIKLKEIKKCNRQFSWLKMELIIIVASTKNHDQCDHRKNIFANVIIFPFLFNHFYEKNVPCLINLSAQAAPYRYTYKHHAVYCRCRISISNIIENPIMHVANGYISIMHSEGVPFFSFSEYLHTATSLARQYRPNVTLAERSAC